MTISKDISGWHIREHGEIEGRGRKMETVVLKTGSGMASLGREHLNRDLREPHGCLERSVLGRNSQCKGPEAFSLDSRNGEEASGVEGSKGQVG